MLRPSGFESPGWRPDGGARCPQIYLLGVPVNVATRAEVLAEMERWIQERKARRWIAVTNSHGIVEAFRDPEFKRILESADLSVMDGYRVARFARWRGYKWAEQITGADLLRSFSRVAAERGYRSFFFGDTQEVLDLLCARLQREYPGFRIAGALSPPFRSLSRSEELELVATINAAAPDVLWVGLGLPKQERWIYRNLMALNVPVTVAVGAAFKLVSGMVKEAPLWMRRHGLEWIWRLVHEPRRIAKRVFVHGPLFMYHGLREQISGTWRRTAEILRPGPQAEADSGTNDPQRLLGGGT